MEESIWGSGWAQVPEAGRHLTCAMGFAKEQVSKVVALMEPGDVASAVNPKLVRDMVGPLDSTHHHPLVPAWGTSHPIVTISFRDGTSTPTPMPRRTRDPRRPVRCAHYFTMPADKLFDGAFSQVYVCHVS